MPTPSTIRHANAPGEGCTNATGPMNGCAATTNNTATTNGFNHPTCTSTVTSRCCRNPRQRSAHTSASSIPTPNQGMNARNCICPLSSPSGSHS
ncbi:hypothetical protein LC603019_01051 [Lawsonella clevelandensis]|uniref:Uncharacterized protein n=1 Tax=Lawsonella clevelandensis TaxID=1528099 RepID=A0A5E3ZXR1_9ACTN|nr:hypothetical protein LC603019_01051 [Lawsonella clevelandensis]